MKKQEEKKINILKMKKKFKKKFRWVGTEVFSNGKIIIFPSLSQEYKNLLEQEKQNSTNKIKILIIT